MGNHWTKGPSYAAFHRLTDGVQQNLLLAVSAFHYLRYTASVEGLLAFVAYSH